jgi:ATP-dependent exoDNAse (exonuclease V) beta subunit
MNNINKVNNAHTRDENIQFIEDGHKYTIKTDSESKYISVTTLIHLQFAQFDADKVIKNIMCGKNWKEGHKYWGLTAKQIKQQWASNASDVSCAGTNLHNNIECFMNHFIPLNYTHKEIYDNYMQENNAYILKNGSINSSINTVEWNHFIDFIKDTPDLKPYKTEWTVYNEDVKIAGSIDMVYEHPDGTLSIYDWKRCKDINKINYYNKYAITPCICHLPDTNFWHYALQLNIYKKILEEKYGKKVIDLFLVKLHPNEESYEMIEIPMLDREIDDLFLLRKNT